MQIGLACDHAGFELKEELKAFLKSLGLPVSSESRIVKTIEEVIDFWQTWEARRSRAPRRSAQPRR